ncbi:MAG: tRNA pseudouridine(55) synthase TruB [Desulfovibrio sp.]|uniref:tRNA pseudouridine(55) synthase TruB n=1 Tax=Desulfovibrio sp. 7SRBS1 TaxID=3378064 RepID=UPI003B3EC8C1
MGRRNKRPVRDLHGLLILHKPSGPTSADCLNMVKKALGNVKIGHAGTLDPLASGVLLALLGNGTKLAPYLTGHDKTYRGSLRLGQSTDTYDIQGEVLQEAETNHISAAQLRDAILDWDAIKVQEVPAYSAAKHKGKPLYELARQGKEVPIKTKEITVSGSEAISVAPPDAEFRLTCSSGTYVRSLVHSLGMRMGCGAVMTALTREASGPFTLDTAVSMDEFLERPEELLEQSLLPLEDMLPDWPKAVLSPEDTAKVKNGMRLSAEGQAGPGARAMFLDEDGKALAVSETQDVNGRTKWVILRGLW